MAELDLKLAEKSADVEFLSVSKRKFEIDILNLQVKINCQQLYSTTMQKVHFQNTSDLVYCSAIQSFVI